MQINKKLLQLFSITLLLLLAFNASAQRRDRERQKERPRDLFPLQSIKTSVIQRQIERILQQVIESTLERPSPVVENQCH